MAKKQTYADVMNTMSKKLQTYETKLQEAQNRGDSIGIQDYGRRVQRIQSGIESLFQEQESSKQMQPTMQMGYGGIPRYGNGGEPLPGTKFPRDNRVPGIYSSGISLIPYDGRTGAMTQDGMMAVMNTGAGPVVLTPELWKTYNTKPESFNSFIERIKEDPQGNERWVFNPETYELGTFAKGNTGVLTASTPEVAEVAQQQANVAAEQAGGSAETAAQVAVSPQPRPLAPTSVGGIGTLDFMNQMNDLVMAGAAPAAPAAEPTPTFNPESVGLGMPAITGTAPLPPDVQTFTGPYNNAATTSTELAPETENIATNSVAVGSSGLEDINIGGAPEVNAATTAANASQETSASQETGGEQVTSGGQETGGSSGGGAATTNDNALSNFFSSLQGKQNPIMQYGQFLPDIAAFAQMERSQAPTDLPMPTMARQNTNVNYNPIMARAQQDLANRNAMLSANIADPQLRAAMMQDAANEVQSQFGDTTARELDREQALENQYAQNIAQFRNQQGMIGAQNRQRQIDFENDKRATRAKLFQQAGSKFGQIQQENALRELQGKQLGISALAYEGDMIQRMAERYPALEALITGR